MITLVLALLAVSASAQTAANPTSKLGWSQPNQTVVYASSTGYNLYIDAATVPVPLQTVTCVSGGASSPDVQCSAPFPTMPAGSHTIALTQFQPSIGAAPSQESIKSAPLLSITFTVVVTPQGLKVIP